MCYAGYIAIKNVWNHTYFRFSIFKFILFPAVVKQASEWGVGSYFDDVNTNRW
jgi:hypothetical protein